MGAEGGQAHHRLSIAFKDGWDRWQLETISLCRAAPSQEEIRDPSVHPPPPRLPPSPYSPHLSSPLCTGSSLMCVEWDDWLGLKHRKGSAWRSLRCPQLGALIKAVGPG